MEDPMRAKLSGGASRKRKMAELAVEVLPEEKEKKIGALREESNGLFSFYKEFMGKERDYLEKLPNSPSLDSAIAVLMEESSLPLSKLVGVIFDKLEGKFGISTAIVKNKVILIGQRLYYGLPNADADVLEDESDSVLWCWETRDLKLFPKLTRNVLKIRRTYRKKIHERIIALSSMINTLQSGQMSRSELVKGCKKLGKMLNEADLRLLVQSLELKNGAEMAEKESKREKEELIKQLEKKKREDEREKRKLNEELHKEKLQSEKELKKLQNEAEKEERKQLKKKREEAEKDEKRKEKEEAEFKKQLSLQKQASLMKRFLKRCEPDSSRKVTSFDLSPNGNESTTHKMDSILSHKDQIDAKDMLKLHLKSWRSLGGSIRKNKKMHWSIRKKPKTILVKELKLTTTNKDKDVNEWVNSSFSHESHSHKQLFQFDKSHRPAFYGVWPKKSEIISARHPFVKDPELDYEIDSDEEWEEEEPGESLSDCDKDEEDESLRGEDEDESEDEFFVPDGHLSDDEGVEVDKMQCDELIEDVTSSEDAELSILLGQQKYLHNLTEQALRKNQPLIIINFKHEKAPLLLTDQHLIATEKLEKTCLLALSVCVFPNMPLIEISSMCNEAEEENKGNTTPLQTKSPILDSDFPQIISIIQSCPHGINKLVEILQQKFPNISSSQLKTKVRQVAHFSENRWQVKKDLLIKFGSPQSPPEKVNLKRKSIATFFSKRCLPPSKKSINPNEISPQSAQHVAAITPQQSCKDENK